MSFNNISKRYHDSDFLLKNISFEIGEKEAIGIIGKNGSGKSTLLKMMNGLLPYDEGSLLYHGKEVSSMSEYELRLLRKRVSYIFQNFNLLEGKTVYYHLSLVYKLNHVKTEEEEIDRILDFFNIRNLKYRACKKLSGGQQQKVAIAMTLLQKPEVILCDEISSQLDAGSEKEIFDLLMKWKERGGCAVVIISHNLSVLKQFCDKVLLLEGTGIQETLIPSRKKDADYEEDYVRFVREFLTND